MTLSGVRVGAHEKDHHALLAHLQATEDTLSASR